MISDLPGRPNYRRGDSVHACCVGARADAARWRQTITLRPLPTCTSPLRLMGRPELTRYDPQSTSVVGRYCCKSRFALGVGNSAGCRCDFRVKMRGASSPHVKPTSDFANTSEAIRIGDCFLFDSFAKNSSPCNFRLLQQYRHETDDGGRPLWHRRQALGLTQASLFPGSGT